jgi:DNA polymerase III subunit gamma/tau
MSAAISQKTRPIHWDEVVGQEHVKDVLRPALERGRIGHAYLFSGPRGVGKTTTARLIAMTVNCDDATAVKPCGVCESCRMVIQGRHPDVLEIDAASNNSVEDVRDLREKVALQPMRGSNKVYILDEAHMMSKSAFNALLKTLEEPPAHAVFILATTEPERLPPTILSRCQHYRFRRLSVAEIAGKLEGIAAREGVNADKRALDLIARASDGAMRDGESLLERLLASGEPALTLSQAEGALGLPPQERIHTLALSLARGETGAMLEALGRLYADGFAPRTVTERVKIALRDALHQQLGVGGLRPDEDAAPEGVLLKLIRALDEEDQRFARASDLIALEMAFTKAFMASQNSSSGSGAGGSDPALAARVTAIERSLKDGGPRSSRSSAPDFDPTARTPRPVRAPEARASEPEEPPASNTPDTPRTPSQTPESAQSRTPSRSSGTWGDVVTRAKAQLKAFLREGRGDVLDGVVVLTYGAKHKWHAEQVAAKLADVHVLVREVFGDGVDLELVMPDGSKKNSSTRTDGGSARLNPEPPRAIAPVEPETPTVTRFTPPEMPRASSPVVEHLEPTPAEPPMLEFSEPPILETPPETHRSASALVQDGIIQAEPLEFEQLGMPAPLEPGLFGLQPAPKLEEPAMEPFLEGDEVETPVLLERQHLLAPTAAPDGLGALTGYSRFLLERQHLTGYSRSHTQNLEVAETPSHTVFPEPETFKDEIPEAFLPDEINLETSDIEPAAQTQGLEVTDLSALEDAPPLEAFDLAALPDVPDEVKVKSAKVSAALQGHPTYAILQKMFSHRVREAGALEVKAVKPDDTTSVPEVTPGVPGALEETETA